MIILDTNIISELFRKHPTPAMRPRFEKIQRLEAWKTFVQQI